MMAQRGMRARSPDDTSLPNTVFWRKGSAGRIHHYNAAFTAVRTQTRAILDMSAANAAVSGATVDFGTNMFAPAGAILFIGAGCSAQNTVPHLTLAIGQMHQTALSSLLNAPPVSGCMGELSYTTGFDDLCDIVVDGSFQVGPKPSSSDADSTLSKFQKIMTPWKGRIFTRTYDRLDRQLSQLLDDEDELASDLTHVPNERSFESVLDYMAARAWLRAPSLTLTGDGRFIAHWRPTRDAKARVSVEFLDAARVRWSAVDARSASPSMTGGICAVSELDEHLRPYRSWLCL